MNSALLSPRDPTDRTARLIRKAIGIPDGQVLHPAIGMVDQAGEVIALPAPDGHLEGVQREFGVERRRDVPALTMELVPHPVDAVHAVVLLVDASDLDLEHLVVLRTPSRRAADGVVVRRRGGLQTVQIGSTPKLSRCVVMNANVLYAFRNSIVVRKSTAL